MKKIFFGGSICYPIKVKRAAWEDSPSLIPDLKELVTHCRTVAVRSTSGSTTTECHVAGATTLRKNLSREDTIGRDTEVTRTGCGDTGVRGRRCHSCERRRIWVWRSRKVERFIRECITALCSAGQCSVDQ